jgi:hypothetical protein
VTADAILRDLGDAARQRRRAGIVLHALPWLGVLVALAWRCDWNTWSLLALALAIAAIAWLAGHSARAIDPRWLARQLDALRPDMEDSAALLFLGDDNPEEPSSPRTRGPSVFGSPEARSRGPRVRGDDGQGVLGPLQQLQRARLRQRLEAGPPPDLREPWQRRTLLASLLAALIAVAAIVLWSTPRAAGGHGTAPAASKAGSRTAPSQLVEQRLEIQPPAYTGLPAHRQTTLDAKVPQGATLQWTLRFSPMPESAQLVFHDGRKLALQRNGEDWTARMSVDRSTLYRFALPTPLPAAQAALHRIDAVADTPPVLRALQPDRNLSIRGDGQRSWTLLFEADDDHGLAAGARLQLIQTQGGGENITTRQRTIAVAGRGNARHKRYAHTLDLAALGLVAGDDLIVQLDVADNRAPRPQHTRSPSFILRWPPEQASESTGMDGLVKQALPAYLRSQRQIIIDAEALLRQKRKLGAADFLKRSDALGVDQRLLRLRYGQFLGEESEGAPTLSANDLPTNDLSTNDMPTNDSEESRHGDHDAQAAPQPAAQAADSHAGHDEHAPTPGTTDTKFGEAGAVVAEYGHVHDLPEAATLLDPETKRLLRAALDQMWQSEQHLRQGNPDVALPHAYKALGFIKQVQQADRVYLARTGSELPPIDESRRLGGDRAGLGDRRDVLADAAPVDPVPYQAWRALQDVPPADRASPDYDALARWVRAHDRDAADPLALFAALDAARRDPDCAKCRARLREALWPLLPRPGATATTRQRADKAGRAYLDALDDEAPR